MGPTEFFAGDTVQFSISDADYPATSWTVKYALRGESVLTVTSSPTGSSGRDHGFTLSSTLTTPLPAGSYEWALVATSGSVVNTIDSGRMTVRPNILGSAAGDRQLMIEKTLTAIENVIFNRITADVVAHTIAGRSVTKIPLDELKKLRAQYTRELCRLRSGYKGVGKPVNIYFTRPE
jgi:hypothetical protein